MKNFPRISEVATRDPMCRRIELCLHHLDAQGKEMLDEDRDSYSLMSVLADEMDASENQACP